MTGIPVMRRSAVGILAAALITATTAMESRAAPATPSPDLELFEPGVRGALEEAREGFESAYEGAQDDAGRAAAWGRLGMIYQAHHLQDSARRCYESAVALDADDFRWQYFLAYLHQETGDYERAEVHFARSLEIDPDYLPARLRIGQVRLAGQKTDSAAADFESVLEREPRNAAALAGLGRIALRQRDYGRAVRYLEAALNAEPGADRLYHPLAMAYRQTGRVEQARASLARHGKTDPIVQDPLLADMARLSRSSQMYLEQGYAAARAGRTADAVAAFRKAVQFNPEDAAARVSLGQGLVLSGDDDAALEQFEAALAIEPDHPVARYRRATIAESRGDDGAAVEDYRVALEGDPGYLQAQIRLGDALMRLDRYEEAARAYAAIETSGEGRAMFVYRQGVALLAAGDCSRGIRALESARALKPDSGEIFQALARAYAACPGIPDGQRQEAFDLARQLFEARPDQAHAETLAMAAAAAGRQATAVDVQSRLVELSAARPDPFLEWRRQQLDRYRAGQGPSAAWPAGHPVFRPARLGAGPQTPVGR